MIDNYCNTQISLLFSDKIVFIKSQIEISAQKAKIAEMAYFTHFPSQISMVWPGLQSQWKLALSQTEFFRVFPRFSELDWVRWQSQPIPENVVFSDEIWGHLQQIWMIITLFQLQSASHCVLSHSTEVFRCFSISEKIHILLSSIYAVHVRCLSSPDPICAPPSLLLAAPKSIHPLP